MKSSQTEGINSHIFRFRREYGVILHMNVKQLSIYQKSRKEKLPSYSKKQV